MTASPLIDIKGLRVLFHSDDGRTTHAVDSVDLAVAQGATLGLVGESGCGKSVTSLAIMGLLSKQSAEVSGAIRFEAGGSCACDGTEKVATTISVISANETALNNWVNLRSLYLITNTLFD